MDLAKLKHEVSSAIDVLAPSLIAVSHYIHDNPELNFKEDKAHARLTEEVARAGLPVTRGAYGLTTAFESVFGKDGAPCVAILSEYDALPGIGHACGHNVMSAQSLGAALGLAQLGARLPGRIRYLGTPAEEGGGGKEIMALRGAFEGVDAAMMVHSAGFDLEEMPSIAIAQCNAIYHGVPAHASAMPHRGVNALDALVMAYNGIAALRQHIKQTERIHGIITEGGEAANIVPRRAAGHFLVRAKHMKDLDVLKRRVEGCFQAGAFATGARLELVWDKVDYLELKANPPFARAYRRNAESLGRKFIEVTDLPSGVAGSTDMGNVSYRVPSIHPMMAVAPENVTIHHPDFTAHARSPKGDQAVIDGAKAMAMTSLDYFLDSGLRAGIAASFAEHADVREASLAALLKARELGISAGCC